MKIPSRIIFHSLHKSASMFIFKYGKALAEHLGYPLFSNNLREANESEFLTEFDQPGILAPYRKFEQNTNDSAFRIFLLRDPLDILVSQFYSFAYMHVPDENGLIAGKPREEFQNMGIDSYCLKHADNLFKRYTAILHVTPPNYIMTAYADLVLQFEKWNEKVLSSIGASDDITRSMLDQFQHEFAPLEELTPQEIILQHKKRHKRKMYPGDHQQKLQVDTIALLREKFSVFDPILELVKLNTL